MRRAARAAIAIAGLTLAGCTRDGDAQVAARIAAEVRRGDGTVLRMQDLATFEWTRLYVFPPYSMPEEIDRALGFSWPEGRLVHMESRNDATLLVFVKGGEVQRHVAHKRGQGDFAELGQPGGYSRADAVFRVRFEDGWPRLRRDHAG